MFILKILLKCLVLYGIKCCTQKTFESTQLTALKDLILKDEISDYNYFMKTVPSKVVPITKITGCITSTDEFQDSVAIQIRGERVPILYEGAIQNLLYLHSLHIISSNVVIVKPHAFQNLPSLTILKLQDNNIELIQAHVFNNLMVKKLVLTFNKVSYIVSNAFDNMPRLESVRLDYNRLSTWESDWFENCPRLTLLSLKFNQIMILPEEAFKKTQQSLERLYLSHNKIKEIHPTAFAGLEKLTDLSLFHNNITSLDNSIFIHLKNLKMIDLSETDITCLQDSLLNTLRSDVLLRINNIPLNETCKERLNEWVMYNNNTLTFYKHLRNRTHSIK